MQERAVRQPEEFFAHEGDAALRLLLRRYSVSAKHLRAPAPTQDEVWTMAMAALRAPDRNKRRPFRFVVVRGEGLAHLAALFEDYGRRRGKSGAELEAERLRATKAPLAVAVVARVDAHDPEVAAHEQWICIGGAIGNAVMALHFMGYGAKMVSGGRVEDPLIRQAFCREGEQLVGWIVAGTPDEPPEPRGEIDPICILENFTAPTGLS
jgi:nitroreductase